MATLLKKQRLILAIQSKITLLQKKFNTAQENKDFFAQPEIDAKIKSYQEILSVITSGQFDA